MLKKFNKTPLFLIFQKNYEDFLQKQRTKYAKNARFSQLLNIARKISPKTKLTVARKILLKTNSAKVCFVRLLSALKDCPLFLRLTQ